MIFGRTFKPEPIPTDEMLDEMWALDCAKYNGLVSGFITNRFFKQIGKILNGLPADATILEVGCGLGESSKRLSKMVGGRHFEVSEFDHRIVKRLQAMNLPFPVKQGSIYELPYADNSFDCVICLEVLEHLEDVPGALRELCRVSRKTVLVSVPNEPLWCILNMARLKYLKDFGNTPGHTNHWSAKSFRELLSRYGDVRNVHTPLPFLLAELRPKGKSSSQLAKAAAAMPAEAISRN